MLPRFLKFIPVLAFALLFSAPALADDLYTVAGVHVDASGASSSEALNVAIAQGRPKAWQILYRRLTRQQDWTRQPTLDAPALVRLSRSFTPTNERRSTTRYVADVTYMFNPDAVARTLRDANIAFTQTAVRRILLVPMSPGYNTGPWTQSFAAVHDSFVPFSLPAPGDELGQLNFDNAGWNDVAPAAARIKATEAALVQAVYANGKVTVTIRRLGQGAPPSKSSVDVPMLQTLSTTYPVAAQAAITAMDDMWKSRSAVNPNARGTLIADVKVASLNQWGAIQSALSGTDNVTNVQVVAMNMGYARLSIAYMGSTGQLRDALGGQGLALSGRGDQWTLVAGARLNSGGGQ
jgi:hypothetical protein